MVIFLTKKTIYLFRKKQTSIFSAAFIIMVAVALSRFLGLIRDRMLTARFTADELGIYFAAFRLPNLLFELLVMGALTTAFIPVISRLIGRNKEAEAFRLVSDIINIGLFLFFLFAFFFFLFSDQIAKLIAPGFTSHEREKLIIFTRIMLFGQVPFLLMGNFFTGLLQSYKLFIIPALAPVVYNAGIILGIFFLTPFFSLYGPVWGVVIGAFLFLAIQIPLIYSLGYRYQLTANLKNPAVKTVGKLMLPRTFRMAVSQIDTTVDLILASLLGARNVTIFNLAQHLQLVPVGLFGIPIATAALPSLSLKSFKEDREEFVNLLVNSFNQIIFFVLPASILLVVLRIPIVRLVFGADRFDWQATILTGQTLAAFSLSLTAQSVVQLLARAFFALEDSKTPVLIGIISIVFNTLLSVFFLLFLKLPIWGLGLSASLASLLNALLLLIVLQKRIQIKLSQILLPFLKILFATLITGVFLYVPMKLFDQLIFDTTRTINLLLLTGTVSLIGLVVYLFISWVLALEQIALFLILAKKVVNVKQILLETPQEVVEGGEVNNP